MNKSRSGLLKTCFEGSRKGHFLRACPKRDRYHRCFQYFISLGDAVTYFLSHADHDINDNVPEIFTHFADFEAQVLNEDRNLDENDTITDF